MDVKKNLAANIVSLRQAHGWTQAQFSEKLGYSDKAISKWERSESVPDIATIKEIADLFSVTVDWLISEHETSDIQAINKEKIKKKNYRLITLLSATCVWLVAAIVFVVLLCCNVPRAWLSFIWAITAMTIVFLVFNAIWGQYRTNYLIASILVWTIALGIYITIAEWSAWYIFICGIPLQVAAILGSKITSVNKK